MATYTREQVNRWSSKLQNGFTLDLNALIMRNEKEAEKWVELADGRKLKASIGWHTVYEGYRSTGLSRPELHLSIWRDGNTPGFMVSSGLGAFVEITEETFSRKNWNEIVKMTADWSTEKIMAEASKHWADLESAVIIGK